MSDGSKIEWTAGDDGTPGATWNPVTGCTKVSDGCDHCYAETFAERWRGVPGHHFENGFDVTLRPERLEQPLRWTRPRRIFVNSMSDVFHEKVPSDFIARMFAVMAGAPQHTFQVLTKRHARMKSLLSREDFWLDVFMIAENEFAGSGRAWPLPNVWLGVSAEDQHWANLRIPALIHTPAAVRFVSAEPLLAPISLHRGLAWCPVHDFPGGFCKGPCPDLVVPDWLIIGGESGRGARPMDITWARDLLNSCSTAGIAPFVKQVGSVLGRELGAGPKGGDWSRWPADLRVRQFPPTAEAVTR